MAQRVAMIHKLNSPDYSDKRLLSNFINVLVHGDYLQLHWDEYLEYGEEFYDTKRHLRLLLGNVHGISSTTITQNYCFRLDDLKRRIAILRNELRSFSLGQ